MNIYLARRRCAATLFGMLAFAVLLAPPAAACSLASPTVEDYTQWSEVIAIGTLQQATHTAVILDVELYLKGTTRQPQLTINNQQTDLDAACRLSFGLGPRFPDGVRVLAFLQPEPWSLTADWRPVGGVAEAVIVIDGDQLAPPPDVGGRLGSLSDAQRVIAAAAGPPVRPDPHAAAPLSGSTMRQLLVVAGVSMLLVSVWWAIRRSRRQSSVSYGTHGMWLMASPYGMRVHQAYPAGCRTHAAADSALRCG